MLVEGVRPNKVTFIAVLSACTSREELNILHDIVTEAGCSTDCVVGTSLVNSYGRLGLTEEAHTVFECISERDLISWNALLTVFAEQGECKRAIELFCLVQIEGMLADYITFLALVKSCANLGHMCSARAFHGILCEAGYESAEMVGNALIDMYGKCGSTLDSLLVFQRRGEARDVVSWNTMFAVYGQNGESYEALSLFKRMLHEGVKAEKVTLATLLHSLSGKGSLHAGRVVHAFIKEQGLESDTVIATALLHMYARCGSVDDTKQMFHTLEGSGDVIAWNAFISALSQAELYPDAFHVFQRMQLEGVTPNRVTFASMIDVCTSMSSLNKGRSVTKLVGECGFDSDMVLGNALLDLYGKCGSLEDVFKVFSGMERKDVVSWTTVSAALAQHGQFTESVSVYDKMLLEGVKPSNVTFTTVLYACAEHKALAIGRKVHECSVQLGLHYDALVSLALLSFYAECGDLSQFEVVFRSQHQLGTSAWNTMMVALTRQSLMDEAVQIYRKIQFGGIACDKFTLLAVLEACTELPITKSIEDHMTDMCVLHDDIVNTALLKAYGRCGSVHNARRTFERTPHKDVMAWSAMFAVYAQHGVGDEALELFERMVLEGVEPNDVTFVSIFAACSHLGELERGYRYFFGLEEDYGVRVTAEHCKCMIDLLARAGRLAEAEVLLHTIPFEPDVVLWTSVLAACGIHGNVKLGEHAAQRILTIDHEDEGAHVALSKLYSSTGQLLQAHV